MIGNRLKLKRQADRLSLQELADLLSEYGASATKAALSNYENNKAEPGKEMMSFLCQALGISESFLYHKETELQIFYFTKIDMVPKRQLELDCYVACQIERRIDIDQILKEISQWEKPERMKVSAKTDLPAVSEFAEDLRKSWGLNAQPISSVTNILELQGWEIYELPEAFGVSGVCGYDRISNVPFLYYPTKAGLVNVRMQMLCLIAAAYLDIEDSSLRNEACRRFARTILLSREQAVTEFGSYRQGISREELDFCKYHYGLPKYEIMSRLLEEGIIEEQLYRNYMSQIRQQGYPSARDSMVEPLFFYENSTLYKKKVQYARTEGFLEEENMASFHMMPNIHKKKYE